MVMHGEGAALGDVLIAPDLAVQSRQDELEEEARVDLAACQRDASSGYSHDTRTEVGEQP
jgi:hypothetical protein